MKFDIRDYLGDRNCIQTLDEETDNVWVIGDVHGCGDEFHELCTEIKSRTPNATIMQLGDLIDRGPHFIEVFETVSQFDVQLCVGNHELNFILEHNGFKKCRSKARMKSHEIFDKLSKEQQEFVIGKMMASNNYVGFEFIYAPTIWYLSHSPVSDIHTINENSSAWRHCSRNEPYGPSDWLPYVQFAHGHQHWNYKPINDQVESLNSSETDAINLDGGCVYGGELVAYNICTNDTIVVKAKRTYFK